MTSEGNDNRSVRIRPDSDFLAHFSERKRILVIGHVNPDGDALGSALAMGLGLESLGHQVVVGISGRLSNNLAFICEKSTLFEEVAFNPEDFKARFDLLVLVDCQCLQRVWHGLESGEWELPPFLVIDHHPADTVRPFPVVFFADEHSSSTGELVVKVLKALSVTFSSLMVEALLMALGTDTGFFTQGNTTVESLSQAAELVAQGGNIEYIYEQLRQRSSFNRLALLKEALATLTLHCEGRVGTMLLTEKMLKETGATIEDADGFVDYPRSLAGVVLAVLLRVDGRGNTRVSLRSRVSVDAAALARSFGGGGHRQAAAYTDSSPDPAEALKHFLERVKDFIGDGH